MTEKKKMTLQGYYEHLKNLDPHIELREKICDKLEMPISTFYHKLRNDSFDKLEQKEIARITKRKVKDLFPNK